MRIFQNGEDEMLNFSVNTNMSAITALHSLNTSEMRAAEISKRISTGKMVADVRDNGAIWSIAQTQRSEVASLGRVIQSLNRGSSVIDPALAAADTISDMLIQMKEKALAAADGTLDSVSRQAINEDFKGLRDNIEKILSNAEFNNVNLVDGSTSSHSALSDESGGSITVQGEDLSLGGGILTMAATASLGTQTLSNALISEIDSSIENLSLAMTRLSAGQRRFDQQSDMLLRHQEAVQRGIGNLVDADMARESARFQAEQTRLQLRQEGLAIANRSTQVVLALFQS